MTPSRVRERSSSVGAVTNEAQRPPNPAIRVSMMPADTNAHGTIFGGHILSLLDQAGAIAAHGVGARKVVTVAVRNDCRAPNGGATG